MCVCVCVCEGEGEDGGGTERGRLELGDGEARAEACEVWFMVGKSKSDSHADYGDGWVAVAAMSVDGDKATIASFAVCELAMLVFQWRWVSVGVVGSSRWGLYKFL